MVNCVMKSKIKEDSLKSIDTDIYSNTRIVKKNVKVNKVNAVQISAEISGKDLGNAMTEFFSGLGLGDEFSFDTSALQPIKVNIWIDQKTYLPIKVSTDMTAFVNDYMENGITTSYTEEYYIETPDATEADNYITVNNKKCSLISITQKGLFWQRKSYFLGKIQISLFSKE